MNPEIKLDDPAIDVNRGGYGREFMIGKSITGRVVFGFKGDRDNRTYSAEARFDHDPLCTSFTAPLETAAETVGFITDDEAAGVLIRTALD